MKAVKEDSQTALILVFYSGSTILCVIIINQLRFSVNFTSLFYLIISLDSYLLKEINNYCSMFTNSKRNNKLYISKPTIRYSISFYINRESPIRGHFPIKNWKNVILLCLWEKILLLNNNCYKNRWRLII